MPTLNSFFEPTCSLISNLMLVVVAHLSGVWEVFYNTSVTYGLDKSLNDRGVGQTHTWYIMTIDCNAPAFLTPDKT